MTQSTTSFAALVLPLIGRSVLVTDKAGSEAEYKIWKLSDKLGTLKDGSKGEYVILQNSTDTAIVINVHPASAKRLVTKGEEAGMKLVAEAVEPVEAAPEAVEPVEAAPEAAEPVEAAPEAAEPVVEPKAPSKKELFMAFYKAGVAAGSDRKTIKAAVAELGLSEAGFNTYYQNAKSGKWA